MTLISEGPDGPVVNRVWEGRIGVVLASGPSATRELIDRCRGFPAVAVNDQYLFAPWADALYFADRKWWTWHRGREEFKSFSGVKLSILSSSSERIPGVHHLKNANHVGGETGFSRDPGVLCTGSNSAYQAANVLIHAGCRRVVLLGVDGRPIAGRSHNFGEHPDRSEPPYKAMKEAFKIGARAAAAMGVELVNASPVTFIDTVPLMTLDDALEGAAVPVRDPEPSPYVMTVAILRERDATLKELTEIVGPDARRALGKGLRKGTIVRTDGGAFRHASRAP